MHGIKNIRMSPEEEEKNRVQNRKRVKEIKLLVNKIEKINKKGTYSKEDLLINQNIIVDHYMVPLLWNTRKRILTYLKKISSVEEFDKMCIAELELIFRCIQVDPKVYSVWNHRYFTFRNLSKPDFLSERKFCSHFLALDCRNFHIWNYWRLIIELHPSLWNEELKQTKNFISQDFSNHSAWHHRSLAVKNSTKCYLSDSEFIFTETDLIHSAIFTDPSDLASWSYYNWFLSQPAKFQKPKILCVSLKKVNLTSILIITVKNPSIAIFNEITLKDSLGDIASINHFRYDRNGFSIIVFRLVYFDKFVELTFHQQYFKIITSEGKYDIDFNSYDLTSISREYSFLKNELEVLTTLQSFEPNNRNINLNIIKILTAIDSNKNYNKIVFLTENLMNYDYLRIGYYKSILKKIKEISFLCSLKRKDFITNHDLIYNFIEDGVHFQWIFIHLIEYEDSEKYKDKLKFLLDEMKNKFNL